MPPAPSLKKRLKEKSKPTSIRIMTEKRKRKKKRRKAAELSQKSSSPTPKLGDTGEGKMPGRFQTVSFKDGWWPEEHTKKPPNPTLGPGEESQEHRGTLSKTDEKISDLRKHRRRHWGFKKKKKIVGNKKKFNESYFYLKRKSTWGKEWIIDSTKQKRETQRWGVRLVRTICVNGLHPPTPRMARSRSQNHCLLRSTLF